MSKNYSAVSIEHAIKDPNFSFLESFADANELSKINQENARLLFLQREIRAKLDKCERALVHATVVHKAAYRKAYMDNEGAKNESQRKVITEILCQDEEIEVMKNEQLVKEYNRRLTSIRDELNTLKSITFVIRAEMNMSY